MKVNDDIKGKIDQLHSVTETHRTFEEKLDELITLLSQHDLDTETINRCRSRLDSAFDLKVTRNDFKAFEVIDKKAGASREELLDEFSTLLVSHTFNSKTSTKYLKIERSNKLILMAIGVLMITLGFAMIIMPAPPYFEMFTIFYFSRDNGVTLMDLISLLIVFAGIYVFVHPLYKKKYHAKFRL